MQRSESPLLDAKNHAFFSDLYDHTVHAITTMVILRESATSLRDLHMAAVSNRMNEVMKVLTAFATIFLPLTFLAGIYGMNFENMPELKLPWAYPVLWGVFILVTIAMIIVFKRKRWL